MKVKKILRYIFRSWEEETTQVDRRLQLLPPFFYELLAYLLLGALIYGLIDYLL